MSIEKKYCEKNHIQVSKQKLFCLDTWIWWIKYKYTIKNTCYFMKENQ